MKRKHVMSVLLAGVAGLAAVRANAGSEGIDL